MKKVDLSVAVLAAGRGTRLKLPFPKVLAPILGNPMLHYVLKSLEDFFSSCKINAQVGVVTGHQSELVNDFLKSKNYNFPLYNAYQKEQLGTADAVKSYFKGVASANSTELTMIVCGDTPLLRPDFFATMWNTLHEQKKLNAVAATFLTKDPAGYGRIVRSKKQERFIIKEDKDASSEEKKINEVNAALYLVKTEKILEFLKIMNNKNAAKEFYLTDLFHSNFNALALCSENEEDFLGVNDQDQLEYVSKILKKRKIQSLRSSGVIIPDSSSLHIDFDVEIEEGATINPGSILKGKTKISSNAVVGPYAILTDTKVHKGAKVFPFTVAEDAIIGEKSDIGPMARLRPGTKLSSEVKIGNFVEVKKSEIHKGAKVSHLSYVGDAIIGESSNIGCGFITCNYDGKNKHQTIIGAKTFIGSDCQAVAPINIGENCFVAAGTTITENMPDGSFAIARSKQSTREGMAKRFLKSSDSDKVNS